MPSHSMSLKVGLKAASGKMEKLTVDESGHVYVLQ